MVDPGGLSMVELKYFCTLRAFHLPKQQIRIVGKGHGTPEFGKPQKTITKN